MTQLVEKSALEDTSTQDTAVETAVLISVPSIQTTMTQQVILVTSAFATSIEALFVTQTANAHVTATHS